LPGGFVHQDFRKRIEQLIWEYKGEKFLIEKTKPPALPVRIYEALPFPAYT
jgi:hypothetical protein